MGSAILFRRLLGEALGAYGNDDARQLAGDPDMHGMGQVDRPVEGAALDADGGLQGFAILMPDPRAAIRAEIALHLPAAIGIAGPAPDRAPRQPEVRAPEDRRDPEGRARLLLAFPTVADIEL